MHLPTDTVRLAEAGAVAWEDLPDIIGDLLEAIPSVDLLALADLDSAYRDLPIAADG